MLIIIATIVSVIGLVIGLGGLVIGFSMVARDRNRSNTPAILLSLILAMASVLALIVIGN